MEGIKLIMIAACDAISLERRGRFPNFTKGNNIGAEGVRAIAQAFKENPFLIVAISFGILDDSVKNYILEEIENSRKENILNCTRQNAEC